MQTNRSKNVLLEYDLFVDLFVYACRHAEPDDLQFKRLCRGVRTKLDALTRHHFYSLYKTGASQETRAKARQDYLSAIGLLDSFLWAPEQDVNVTHTEMDIR